MSYEARNRIAPQMAAYDAMRQCWRPYLMTANDVSLEGPVVATDEHGFRRTVDGHGHTLSWAQFSDGGRGARAVVLGGSVAFGVGATSDATTIPSLLNRATDVCWFNFGGRAYNSTQELLLLQLYAPPRLDEAVVLSGVNNLMLMFMAEAASATIAPFFSQAAFSKAVEAALPSEAPGRPPPGLGERVRTAFDAFRQPLAGTAQAERRPPADWEHLYRQMMDGYRRDLRLLAAFARGAGIRATFVLQPLVSWIEKPLSVEEREIFAALDGVSPLWPRLAPLFLAWGPRFRAELASAVGDAGLRFVDLNARSEYASSEWLFVDRVHLTDSGNALTAAMIREACRC